MSEITKFIDTFRQEAEEILAAIESTVLELEQKPDDKECVNRLFRYMHTIKGSGAMFGFNDIVGFTHLVESVLDKVREGKIPVNTELINLILTSRDMVKAMLDAENGSESIDAQIKNKIVSRLQAMIPETEKEKKQGETISGVTAKPSGDSKRETTYRIRFQPNPGLIKTGMEPSLILDELRSMGECMVVAQTESIPPLDELIPDNCYFFWDITLTSCHDFNTIKDIFIFVENDSNIRIEKIEDYIPREMTDMLPRLGEILLERGDTTHDVIQDALSQQKRLGELLVQAGTVAPDRVKSALNEQIVLSKRTVKESAGSIRVASDKLDTLINLVGELVITQARISQLANATDKTDDVEGGVHDEAVEHIMIELSHPIESLERLTRELRDCALSIRMIPIGTTFGKFKRLVRDLSVELGKEINLVTEGGETELDKTVIERLDDPLVHLLRNCIDHGIQAPAEREQCGKPRRGTIRLTASHQGANVVITVEDDGMGIDTKAVREKAIEKKLIAENKELSEMEIYALIFSPGFSTSTTLTKVSGRGVGLDVVKREIDAMGGTVQLTSEKGQYLRISLSLPLTLAIIEGLLVKVGDNLFVLPLAQVEECTELTKELIDMGHGRNMILVRGKLIPFVRLSEIFGITINKKESSEHLAIVHAENLRVGIAVDQILGNIQTVIKSLDRNFRNIESISGATIMGDGTVALIVDIPGLIRCAGREEEMKSGYSKVII